MRWPPRSSATRPTRSSPSSGGSCSSCPSPSNGRGTACCRRAATSQLAWMVFKLRSCIKICFRSLLQNGGEGAGFGSSCFCLGLNFWSSERLRSC